MKINGIVKGEYKKKCPVSWHRCKGNEKLLEHKIRRAVDLGEKTYVYENGCYIIRYQVLNFLIDKDNNEIMTMWKDKTRPKVEISEEIKDLYDDIFLHRKISKEIIELAKVLHK